MSFTRRQTIAGVAAAALSSPFRAYAKETPMPNNDLVLVNAKVTTLDRQTRPPWP
jgi:hypothetical protein